MHAEKPTRDWLKALAFQLCFIILLFAIMIAAAWSFYAAMALWGSFGMIGPLWLFFWLRRNLEEATQEIGSVATFYSNPKILALLVVVTFIGATILSVAAGSESWAFMYISFLPAAYCGPFLSEVCSTGRKTTGPMGIKGGS